MIRSALIREWQVLLRAKGAVINPLAFLLLTTTLFVIAAPDAITQGTDEPAAVAPAFFGRWCC